MNTAQFKIAFELRSIPQRNAHFMTLRGERAKVAEELVLMGLAVRTDALGCEFAYRLNKPGRQALLLEWMRHGSPSREEVEAL